MSAEHRPSMPASAGQEGKQPVEGVVKDVAYATLKYPIIEVQNPARTMKELFRSAILVEANLSQVISVAAGRGMTELATRGIPLSESTSIKLNHADANHFAGLGTESHLQAGVPAIPEKGMAKLLKEVVYPLAAVGGALNAIKSLGDETIIRQISPSIVASPDDLPGPDVALAGAQAFLDADPRNPEIARRAFEVSMETLLNERAARDLYHLDLARVANAGLPRQERAEALLGVRGDFGGRMIARLEEALTPDSVPGATRRQLKVFAKNTVGYVKLPNT